MTRRESGIPIDQTFTEYTAVNMNKITMYSSVHCPYCKQAEALLESKGAQNIEKIHVDDDKVQLAMMMAMTQRRTVPQIFIGKTRVGGYDDLVELDRAGELDALLSAR